MNETYDKYFKSNLEIMENALKSVDFNMFSRLIDECESTIRKGNKIIVTGLGKNVPICDKFVGTMLSMGLNAGFLHTNSAVHGDMGMVKKGDLVIILTKSGSTRESVYLFDLLSQREEVDLWLVSFEKDGVLSMRIPERTILINMTHEGDLWNIVPNNSTTINLIVLQTVAIELSKRMGLTLEKDFKPNHPGGAIGAKLSHE